MSIIYNYLKQHCYPLSGTAIMELNKKGTTILNPFLTEEKTAYYGIEIYKYNKYRLFYVNKENQLSCLCLDLSSRQSVEKRTTLTLEFCKIIAKYYKQVNFLEAFNSFQLRCCLEFRKYGFVTTTEDFNSYSLNLTYRQSYQKKKTLVFPTIDILTFYRWYFDINESLSINTTYTSVVYLLFCCKTQLIKICESTASRFNKNQILELNPNCDIIAYWKAPSYEEEKLTHIFSNKEQANSWYHFSFDDLQLIKDRINSYTFHKESIQRYKWAM